MSRNLIMAIIAACLTVSVIASSPAGQTFQVQNVDSSDVLNMREVDPGTESVSDAPIVGTIPHDGTDVIGTGLSLEINGSRWRQVRYGETVGWVNGKFLRPSTGNFELNEADSLVCSGTEPFWGLTIAGGTASFTDPEFGTESVQLDVKASRPGLNRSGLRFHYVEAANGQTGLSLISNLTDKCSDGMSDYIYSVEAFLMGLRPGEGPAQGCCAFAP